ncbi:hypothetical protein [Smaragdicoccus niigatensis]|uniref:hypothetical protein n=1 Tax=Smaragdicoccus niigatensis TaxID=359359 RepID=UPI0003725EDA|nr:hypothetical protein [Smaragdicoccus niigatensis]
MFARTFQEIANGGRLPTLFMLLAIIAAFTFIRFSTRMIRAEVKWWPGNITPGGLHLHHVVFGVGFMLVGGLGLVVLAPAFNLTASCVLAAVFGVGVALVLDEFALILHLSDVYWANEGRSSIAAVFAAIAITGLFLLGFHPLGIAGNFDLLREDQSVVVRVATLGYFTAQCVLAVIVLLKGKFWTGFLGMIFVPFLAVGAFRLSRPRAPWAKHFYANSPEKLARSKAREQHYRAPFMRRFQDAVGGPFGVQPPETP